MTDEGPQVVEQREPLLGRELRDALVEEIAFGGRLETEPVEAAPARVREEPCCAHETDRLARMAQDEPLLANAVRGAVLDHHRHGPHLAGRLRARVREVAVLRELELERPARLLCADAHERMPWLVDPRVHDRRHVLP